MLGGGKIDDHIGSRSELGIWGFLCRTKGCWNRKTMKKKVHRRGKGGVRILRRKKQMDLNRLGEDKKADTLGATSSVVQSNAQSL